MSATNVNLGSADVAAPFFDLASNPQNTDPAQLATRVSCADLELSDEWVGPREHLGTWSRLVPGTIELFDKPQGRRVAQFAGSGGAYVGLDHRGWRPIAGSHPFEFEGWTPARNVTSAAGPVAALAEALPRYPTHILISPLPVRASAVVTDKPVGQLMKNAPIRTGNLIGPFVEVASQHAVAGPPKQLPGFATSRGHAGELPPFYALASDVERSAKAVTAPPE